MISSDDRVILRTNNLNKWFNGVHAVKDLNLELFHGEIFGFLGPNGAGKTTTVGMFLGLIAPTSGTIEAFGVPLRNNLWKVLRRVGAIIESPAFYPYLSGRDNLSVVARALGGVPEARIDEALERVKLSERAGSKFRTYSLGMKQRLGIASSLLRDPDLIILDEPTRGLDPAGTLEVRELIPRLAAEGRTVFLCSHILHEVEQVCHRVGIVKEGRLLVSASIDELPGRGQVLQVRVENPEAAAAVLRDLPWVESVQRDNEYLIVGVPADKASSVSAALAEHRIYASEIASRSRSLESIFLELTGGKSGD